MLEQITYFKILNLPIIVYLGILTFISLLFTILIAILNKKGINKIQFKWHYHMTKITVILALIHGTLGILAYF